MNAGSASSMQGGSIRTCTADCCPACGGGGGAVHRGLTDRLHGTDGRWTFVGCRGCATIWLNPRPIDEDLGECYPTLYFTHHGLALESVMPRLVGAKGWARRHVLASSHGYRFEKGPRAATVTGRLLSLIPTVRRRAVHALGPLLPRFVQDGTLLDVGCGNGAYLAQLRAYGWRVMGQEVDGSAAEAAERDYGVSVTTMPLAALALQEPGFDVVTAAHVIEHVSDAVSFLRDCARCLRPGGRLILVTPNASSLGRKFFADNWYALDPPRHLAVYSPEGLRLIASSVNELRDSAVQTHSRTASKIFRLSAEVRRHGRFRTGRPTPTTVRTAARLYEMAERTIMLAAPRGEELILTAKRAEP